MKEVPVTYRQRGIAVVEQFVKSKSGEGAACEDDLFFYADFCGVVDGVTSKQAQHDQEASGGQVAAAIISGAFETMPADVTARQAADILTEQIAAIHAAAGSCNSKTLAAAIAVISLHRRELWLIGDCQAMLANQLIRYENRVDRVMSEARSLVLELAHLTGSDIGGYRQTDPGRSFILPLLKQQTRLHNRLDSPFGYAIVNGEAIPDAGIKVAKIPDNVADIVLATDGYPVLLPTLASSEARLQAILLDDPMMYRQYLSTKGKMSGHVSYDDRAYLRIYWPG